MGFSSNPLYDPRMRNNVCVSGQLLLVDLIEHLEKIDGIKLIQSNTDGVLFQYNTEEQLEKIKQVSDEWSKRTRLNLDYDYFHKIIQKDVNNYIALGEYNVFVGGYVKDLNELDYDLPVINKAIREYFINGTTPDEYIYKENRLVEFQKIVKVSNKYECAIHNNIKQPEKTLRVFASNRATDGVVYKYRKNQTAKFANTSDKVFIDNGNVKNKQAPSYLDKDWYVNLAWRRINQFLGK